MATTINASTSGLIETSDGTAVLALQTGGTTAVTVNATQAIGVGSTPSFGSAGQFLTSQGSAASPTWTSGGSGTVTSVSWTGGIVSIATATSTPAFTIAGTSGGIPYFSGTNTWASSAALTQYALIVGGGAGAAPAPLASLGTTTTVLHGNAAGAPTFGAVSLTADVSGTLSVANGGTGQTTYTDGQLLIGNTTGNTLTKATLTAGTNVTITNGNGSITIAASGGGGGSSATPTAEGIVYGYTPNGSGTVALGYQASNNSFRPGCTAIGYAALTAITSGSDGYNTCVGANAGQSITTAGYSTLVGQAAGSSLITGASNTVVGNSANVSASGAVGQMVFGQNLTGQADFTITIGGPGGSKIYNAYTVNATWATASDERLKKNIKEDHLGLSFIKRLRPVTFTWKPSNEIDPSLPYYNETNQRNSTTVVHGLIAQEVKAALDAEGCTTFNGWDAGNADTIQAVSREMFVSPLIKAIQELTARLEALEAKVV